MQMRLLLHLMWYTHKLLVFMRMDTNAWPAGTLIATWVLTSGGSNGHRRRSNGADHSDKCLLGVFLPAEKLRQNRFGSFLCLVFTMVKLSNYVQYTLALTTVINLGYHALYITNAYWPLNLHCFGITGGTSLRTFFIAGRPWAQVLSGQLRLQRTCRDTCLCEEAVPEGGVGLEWLSLSVYATNCGPSAKQIGYVVQARGFMS